MGGLHEPPVSAVALRRARNPYIGVFFLLFLLRLHVQKKKQKEYLIFCFVCWLYLFFSCRGEHRSPAKKHKVTFPLSYFCMTKSTKSQQGGLAPSSFQTTAACTSQSREPCVASACGTVAKQNSAVLQPPRFQLYHACEHITRDSRADSCTHCLHARYKCKAGVALVCSLTG